MKLRQSTFYFLSLFFFINCSFIFSQRDTIKESNIYLTTKPLQFGNDLLLTNNVDIPESTPDYLVLSKPAMDYYQSHLVYDPVRDPKRLLYNTGFYFGAAAVAFGILWVSPESFSRWDKDKIREEGFFKRWQENVKAGPVWDEDDWFLNWITHPWAGAIYYMSARGSGFKWWESFLYSTVMSTFFWEYGIEAFAEIPSWQDLLITPTVGSALGELFFIAKGNIVRNDRRLLNSKFLGVTSIILMDPFNELLNAMGYKTKNKVQTYSTIAPVGLDPITKKSIWGVQVAINF